jgi:hypothetical protein
MLVWTKRLACIYYTEVNRNYSYEARYEGSACLRWTWPNITDDLMRTAWGHSKWNNRTADWLDVEEVRRFTHQVSIANQWVGKDWQIVMYINIDGLILMPVKKPRKITSWQLARHVIVIFNHTLGIKLN